MIESVTPVEVSASRPVASQPPFSARLRDFVMRVHTWLSVPPSHMSLLEVDVYAVGNYCAIMCLSAHVLFGIVFYLLGVMVPAMVNVVSVAIFALCLFFTKRGQTTTGVMIGCTEVLAHAWMATIYVGWASGFHFYVLLAISILYLFARIHIVTRIIFSALQIGGYVGLALYAERHPALVTLPIVTVDGLAVMNIVILCLVLIGMLSYYTYAVRTARHQLGMQNLRLETALVKLHKAQDQVIAQQKLAHLGTLTAGIAHEIKNPLNFVNNFAALSQDAIDDLRAAMGRLSAYCEASDIDEVRDSLEVLEMNARKIREHGTRADRVVQSMLLHAGASTGVRERTDLNALVSQSINLARSGAHGDLRVAVEMEVDLDPELPLAMVAPRDLARALLNIIGNAVQAAGKRAREEGGDFKARVKVSTRTAGPNVVIRVRDNGPGVPELLRERIFEPFFTTHPSGEGTGLGLSISHDIVAGQHKGRLFVESEPSQFAEFVIEIPLDDSRTAA